MSDSLRRSLLNKLQQHISPADKLIFNPRFSGYSLPLLLIRPKRGMTIFSFLSETEDSQALLAAINGEVEYLRCARRLMAMHIPGIDTRRDTHQAIKIVIVVNAIPQMQSSLAGGAELISMEMLGGEEEVLNQALPLPIAFNRYFSEEVATRFIAYLSSQPLARMPVASPAIPAGVESAINAEPEFLAGSACTGKSMALAHIAARAASHGKSALIVLPNIEAIPAMRRRLYSLPLSFSPALIDLAAINDLQRIPAARYARYDYLLIDDAHLLTPAQFSFLSMNFLNPGGKRCAAHNPLLASAKPLPVNMLLNESLNPSLAGRASLISRIAAKLNPSLPAANARPNKGEYVSLKFDSAQAPSIAGAIYAYMQQRSLSMQDCLITSQHPSLIREIFGEFIEKGFDPQCPLTPPLRVAHLLADKKPSGELLLRDNTATHRFNPAARTLKLIPAQNLSGIFAPHIIYINKQSAITDYRALYRAATHTLSSFTVITIP